MSVASPQSLDPGATLRSEARSASVSGTECLAWAYLVLPTALFLALAVRWSLALPALLVLALQGWLGLRQLRKPTTAFLRPLPALTALAALWIFLSGAWGLSQPNQDWSKHYALLNSLAQETWWPHNEAGTLRYSLGWYLVPALLARSVGLLEVGDWAALWSLSGLLLFFCLLLPLFGPGRWRPALGAALFMAFAGADLLGQWLSGYQHYVYRHLEWWSGWTQYSAPSTALLWTPQHALPAWLGIGLLLRADGPRWPAPALLPPLLLFWSPFAALGLLPLAAFACLASRQPQRIALEIVGAVLIALPVLLFLQADAAALPHGPIWAQPCVLEGAPCFSWPGLGLFLLLEIGGAALLLLRHPGLLPRPLVLLALLSLVLLPLLRVGAFNDLSMRASLPALGLLALGCARAALNGPGRRLALLVLALGLPVPLMEVSRGFAMRPIDYRAYTLPQELSDRPQLTAQYYATRPPWVLRAAARTPPAERAPR